MVLYLVTFVSPRYPNICNIYLINTPFAEETFDVHLSQLSIRPQTVSSLTPRLREQTYTHHHAWPPPAKFTVSYTRIAAIRRHIFDIPCGARRRRFVFITSAASAATKPKFRISEFHFTSARRRRALWILICVVIRKVGGGGGDALRASGGAFTFVSK